MALNNDGLTGKAKPAKKIKVVNLGKSGSFKVHKGKLHRALGVPEGTKISKEKLASASNSKSPAIRRMAASAKGFAAMKH
jgi:hypothetical protein